MMRLQNAAWWTIGGAWLASILGGFWIWERYDTTAGPTQAITIEQPILNRWQLTVFVHPHCPCARASIDELAALAHDEPDLRVQVVFVVPPGATEGWEQGTLWNAAARIASVHMTTDPTGAQARAFGALTSGHAALTNPAGQVVFAGGLTRSRGQGGASAGCRAIRDRMAGQAAIDSTPVYGCPLFDSAD
jgi:hypothetical protein